MPDPRVILTALAELAPAGADRILDVTAGNQPLVFVDSPERAPRNRTVDRLAAQDALHKDERMLRLGTNWVIGVTTVDGATRKVRLPLAVRPVRLERSRGAYRIVAAGDLELTPLVEDPARATEFEAAPGLGEPGWPASVGAQAWLTTVAAAIGLPVTATDRTPPPKMPDDRLVGVTGAALFIARESVRAGVRGTLLDWATRPGLMWTALSACYSPQVEHATVQDDERAAADEVVSPLPLNRSQREVVRRARTQRLTVVSGPPGNGKTHAVVAVALDTVDRGGSVLVATQSGHAAAVLSDMFARYPGPVPVSFGDAEHRAAIALGLDSGTSAGVDEREVRRARAEVAAHHSRVRVLAAAVADALDVEVWAEAAPRFAPLVPGLAADTPRAFEPDADLDAAQRLLDRMDGITGLDSSRAGAEPRAAGAGAGAKLRTGSGWRAGSGVRAGAGLRAWWAGWRLRRRLGAASHVPVERLRTAVEAARSTRAAARLETVGGTDLGASWEALADAEAALARAVGAAMRAGATSARRVGGAGRQAAAGLASALRAGRNRRRDLLASLDGAALIRALPLWVGTVTDVEDLLPPAAGLFDLVILDEASHIDQIRAAPVLARARRALVVGDPRQLRFVSFTADVDVSATIARHGLDDRVDVRRVSAFDLAAGAAPVTWLAEHYRSAPHLIEFSAHRFYADRFTVATRHPRNEGADVIDIVEVPGAKVTDGVCRAEVDAVLATVASLAAEGVRGIGVVSPFRAQADALEAALLRAYDVEEIERLGLRVGTVHAFQGSEASVVVASLGLGEKESPSRLRFVADPNLFNVMVTRGRDRMIVVTGLTSASGIIGDYLAYSRKPPAPVAEGEVVISGPASWPKELATELARLGRVVHPGYPVGPWTVDLCLPGGQSGAAGRSGATGRSGAHDAVGVEAGVEAVGLICGVHPDGVEAHIERQRALTGAGWRLVDAFASRWSGDAVRAALDLTR